MRLRIQIVTAGSARQRQDDNSRIENLKLKREESSRESPAIYTLGGPVMP